MHATCSCFNEELILQLKLNQIKNKIENKFILF